MISEYRDETDSFDSVEHLGPEAIAAYVDNELSPAAADRARVHLVHCPLCRHEVQRQRQAAESVRQRVNDGLRAPRSLIAKLAQLETSCPEGPGADEVHCGSKPSLMDRVEVFCRAVRHVQGR
ncbi:Anti-sigma-E factor RseA [Corynebacterium ciconiae DSM 44920]|uniref:anti-sigma factor family protein n=1 Tax=Corynebacterium ciconiae TaxID=227319 RepID=UPI000365C416|nr:zf-HC2 domain-containing protein [Corynebacterium ciconiae]WKD60875.1 Anti-sigma-E factor RseA [Corynebacterium ciconiae DSM 44920]